MAFLHLVWFSLARSSDRAKLAAKIAIILNERTGYTTFCSIKNSKKNKNIRDLVRMYW